MLMSLKHLATYHLHATDGGECRVKDFYFDDADWVVRYLIADTGHMLPGPRVLIACKSLITALPESRAFKVDLTRDEIDDSPPIHADQPVSRQMEERLHRYYEVPCYWGLGAYPVVDNALVTAEGGKREPSQDSHLRSLGEVTGYHIKAQDGAVGHLEDLIVETDSWSIRYAVVDTRNWLPGRRVLIARHCIEAVHWLQKQIVVDLTCAAIEDSPEYDPKAPVNRDGRAGRQDYHGRSLKRT